MAQAVTKELITIDVAVSIDQVLAKLKELPGIGDWTVQYFAMRVFGWPDAFPYSDLGTKMSHNRGSLGRAEFFTSLNNQYLVLGKNDNILFCHARPRY